MLALLELVGGWRQLLLVIEALYAEAMVDCLAGDILNEVDLDANPLESRW